MPVCLERRGSDMSLLGKMDLNVSISLSPWTFPYLLPGPLCLPACHLPFTCLYLPDHGGGDDLHLL